MPDSIYLKIDGQDVTESVSDAIISVEVDGSLSLPEMFAIHLMDPNLALIDADTFSIGKTVEISTETDGLINETGSVRETIFAGEITAIEPRLNRDTGPTLLLRGYDKSHRLNRDRKSTTFVNQKDSDIASSIAGNYSLSTDVDSTSQVHEHVFQDNQTDWEFLVARARRVGYCVYVKSNTLYFKEAPEGEAPTLEWGAELLEFNARLTASQQVSKVVVQGWDPANQQQIVGEATDPEDTPTNDVGEGGPTAQSAFGTANEIIVDRSVTTQAEADTLAQSICDEIGQGFMQAECLSLGHPRIQAGATVELRGLGDRFSGSYRVTHVSHRYDESGYMTEFTVGARHTSTIVELLSPISKANNQRGPMLGVVTNAEDPDDHARVKVKIPSLKVDAETGWARLVAPGAGPERGFQWIPEVNDEVLVLFEHGDINRPLVLGGLWSGSHALSAASSVSDGTVNQRVVKSRSGHVITLDDTDGSEKIIVESKDGHQFILDDGEKKISVIDQTGSNTLVIDSNTNNMDINVDGDFSVTATGKVTIKSTGDMSLEATGNGKFKTTGNLDMEATGNGTVKGVQLTLEGTAKSELKAATVSVNGSAMTEVKGGLVKIN